MLKYLLRATAALAGKIMRAQNFSRAKNEQISDGTLHAFSAARIMMHAVHFERPKGRLLDRFEDEA